MKIKGNSLIFCLPEKETMNNKLNETENDEKLEGTGKENVWKWKGKYIKQIYKTRE